MRIDRSTSPLWLVWTARAVLVVLIAVVAVVLAKNGAAWLDQIRSFRWDVRWPLLVLAASMTTAAYAATPTGWVWLCRAAGSATPTSGLRAAWFVSQLGRYMPGKVWLFAGRAGYLRAQGMSMLRAGALPFLELAYTAAGAGVAAAVPTIVSGDFAFGGGALRGTVIAAGACMVAVPLLSPMLRLLYRLRVHGDPSGLPLPTTPGMLRTVALFAGLWMIRGTALYLWLTGFGLETAGLGACVAAAPLSWLAGYIAFMVPGGIGVREAAVVALAAPSGQTGPALAIVAGERIVLGILELGLAALSAGRSGRLRGHGRKEDA